MSTVIRHYSLASLRINPQSDYNGFMCGRASTTFTDAELVMRYLSGRPLHLPDLRPNYNLAPSQKTVVLRITDGERAFSAMRWGLVPTWAKSIQDASRYSLINAKSEEITEKRSYKGAFDKRRAICPVTSFFEWQKRGAGPKAPYCIRLKNEPIMSLAGIWEHWKSKESAEEVYSFAIITTNANELMGTIHNRMPVLLDQADEENWLDPENTNIKELQKLLKPCPFDWLEAYEVSTLVNSPTHNRPEILQPVHTG